MSTDEWFVRLARGNFEISVPQQRDLTVLQLGVFAGDATAWLLNNRHIARIDDVDTWQGDQHVHTDFAHIEAIYDERFKDEPRVHKHKMLTDDFWATCDQRYDFIYIDGDHSSYQTLLDALNAWRHLKPGGVMAFDDYLWEAQQNSLNFPKTGVDMFCHLVSADASILAENFQRWIRRNP